MGKGETTDKKETWSTAKPSERESSAPTTETHQWYVRTYQPQAFLSIGNCGPGEEDKSLEGLLITTDENIGAMAKKNIYVQSAQETTVDVETDMRMTAGKEMLLTSPGTIAAISGGALEFVVLGATADGLATSPFAPVLGSEEDGGLSTIEGVENTRTDRDTKRKAALAKFAAKHKSDHTLMRNFGIGFAACELALGSFFAWKGKKNLAGLTGGLTTFGGAAMMVHDYLIEEGIDDHPDGVAALDAMKEVSLYGGEVASMLAGKYAKVEGVLRVFVESAGMVSCAGTLFSAFGVVNAEVMGGVTSGLLAGLDAEVNAGRHVTIEAQKGHVTIKTEGHNKHIDVKAEHGSSVNVEADGEMKIEAKKEIHVESEEAVRIKGKETVVIHVEDGDHAIHITADGGLVTIVGKTIQCIGDEEVSLLVGGSGVTVKDGSVVIKDGSGSHKFSGGSLDSVTAAALASAKKQFKSAISKLKQQYGQLKDRIKGQRDLIDSLKTGKA